MLPLNDAERVYVSIGEDFGASVLSAALLLQMGVKRITARAVSKLHQSILEAMGIGNIILPEVYVADLLSNEAEFPHLKGFYSVTDDVKFVESIVPPVIAGQSIEAVDFPRTFGLQILGVKRPETSKNIIGKKTVIYELLSPDAKLVIQSEDLLLLYGGLSSLKKFKKQFG